MRPDLIGDVGASLVACGAALQWLRAQKGIPDWISLPLGVIVAVGLWALAVDWHSITDIAAFVLKNITTVATLISALFGGTFAVSAGSKAIVAAHPSAANNMAVPLTDSK